MDSVVLGQRIRLARERKGLSQEEFAARIAKDQRAISEYERGKRRIWVTDLPTIAQVLDVPILYFFDDELSSTDLDHEILRQFQALPNQQTRIAAVNLLRVFSEALRQLI